MKKQENMKWRDNVWVVTCDNKVEDWYEHCLDLPDVSPEIETLEGVEIVESFR